MSPATCFGTKIPSSGSLITTKDRKSNMHLGAETRRSWHLTRSVFYGLCFPVFYFVHFIGEYTDSKSTVFPYSSTAEAFKSSGKLRRVGS